MSAISPRSSLHNLLQRSELLIQDFQSLALDQVVLDFISSNLQSVC